MNILDRFEESVEQLVEGSVSRLMRSPVQPAEIGPKLERAMFAQQVVSVGGILVPNEYRVALNPADLARFAAYVSAVNADMEQWLTRVAADHGFTFVDRVRVEISADPNIRQRAIQVSAAISDHHARPPAAPPQPTNRTEVYQPASPRTLALTLRIISGNGRGQEVALRDRPLSIGRASDNDIVLAAPDVSRHHARLEPQAKGWRLRDLDSTNGTRVNGKTIRAQTVNPGDRLTFGSITAELAADRQSRP